MLTFLFALSLAYVATVLLTSGVGHVWQFAHFRAQVRAHQVLPSHLTMPTAAAVVIFELVTASAALTPMWWAATAPFMIGLFMVCALVGCLFLLYVRALLRTARSVSCGCSPWASPLTPASLAPAAALTLVSGLGAVISACGLELASPLANDRTHLMTTLAVAWGVTLAGLIFLLPASMPILGRREWK